MNKGYIGPLIFITIVAFTAFLTISFSIAPRDVSWINEVENWIRRENWELGREHDPIMLDSFFLCENGEEEFFYLYSQNEFVFYIDDLTDDIDRMIIESISKEKLDEILATNKVLIQNSRMPENYFTFGKYWNGYFILEDHLGMGLEGAIILQHWSPELSDTYYDVWEIKDWIL